MDVIKNIGGNDDSAGNGQIFRSPRWPAGGLPCCLHNVAHGEYLFATITTLILSSAGCIFSPIVSFHARALCFIWNGWNGIICPLPLVLAPHAIAFTINYSSTNQLTFECVCC